MVSGLNHICRYASREESENRLLIIPQAGGADQLQAALTKLATTGCELAITELDIEYASSEF